MKQLILCGMCIMLLSDVHSQRRNYMKIADTLYLQQYDGTFKPVLTGVPDQLTYEEWDLLYSTNYLEIIDTVTNLATPPKGLLFNNRQERTTVLSVNTHFLGINRVEMDEKITLLYYSINWLVIIMYAIALFIAWLASRSIVDEYKKRQRSTTATTLYIFCSFFIAQSLYINNLMHTLNTSFIVTVVFCAIFIVTALIVHIRCRIKYGYTPPWKLVV